MVLCEVHNGWLPISPACLRSRCQMFGAQVNEVLEALLLQLQAHNHPHASAVQAAINLAGASLHSQKPMHQVKSCSLNSAANALL